MVKKYVDQGKSAARRSQKSAAQANYRRRGAIGAGL